MCFTPSVLNKSVGTGVSHRQRIRSRLLLGVLDSMPTVYISSEYVLAGFVPGNFPLHFYHRTLFCGCSLPSLTGCSHTYKHTGVRLYQSTLFLLIAGSGNEPGARSGAGFCQVAHCLSPDGQAGKLSKSPHPLCRG